MEQATEYLLTHPPPLMGGVVRDLSMSEEDQMMRAIAMSLGQDIPMDQRAESPEEAACRKEEEERRAPRTPRRRRSQMPGEIRRGRTLGSGRAFGFHRLHASRLFQLLDELPDTVYRVCDLIMTAVKRNGAAYRDSVLKQVVKQVWEAADVLIKAALPPHHQRHQNGVGMDQSNGDFASSFQLGHSYPSPHPPLRGAEAALRPGGGIELRAGRPHQAAGGGAALPASRQGAQGGADPQVDHPRPAAHRLLREDGRLLQA
ncbi:E3 ubiquitin-protein ligase HUWE1-like [Spheniscus humboldti]